MKTFTTHDWITAYQKHLGFALCEIPAGGKGPRTPNWGNNPIPYGGYPTTVGIGLIHGRSGTCAIACFGTRGRTDAHACSGNHARSPPRKRPVRDGGISRCGDAGQIGR